MCIARNYREAWSHIELDRALSQFRESHQSHQEGRYHIDCDSALITLEELKLARCNTGILDQDIYTIQLSDSLTKFLDTIKRGQINLPDFYDKLPVSCPLNICLGSFSLLKTSTSQDDFRGIETHKMPSSF
jgi:hypothetical protein